MTPAASGYHAAAGTVRRQRTFSLKINVERFNLKYHKNEQTSYRVICCYFLRFVFSVFFTFFFCFILSTLVVNKRIISGSDAERLGGVGEDAGIQLA